MRSTHASECERPALCAARAGSSRERLGARYASELRKDGIGFDPVADKPLGGLLLAQRLDHMTIGLDTVRTPALAHQCRRVLDVGQQPGRGVGKLAPAGLPAP